MKKILRHLIEAQPNRRINYEQYMKTVLYHPEKGYYRKPSVKIGKAGDFYTSPSVHPVFGWTLARFFIDLVRQEQLPPIICEMGAGDGRLAAAVLKEWKRLDPDSYRHLNYFAIEDSPYHRFLQNKYVSDREVFVQYADFEQFRTDHSRFSGILFSNEWFDAFPVRVVEKVGEELNEVKITLDGYGELIEILEPSVDSEIVDWLDSYGFQLQTGQRIEIPLLMTHWLKDTAEWMERGGLLTIDYGYTEEEWQQPGRKQGSLRGYHQHHLLGNPLLHPGEMDLTSHIHVDALRKTGEKNGLDPLFLLTQRLFLLRAGILNDLREPQNSDPFSPDHRQNRAIRTLISDSSLGNAFHAMMQGKGLSGRFAEEWTAREPLFRSHKKRR